MRLKGVVYLCLIMALCLATEILASPAGYVVDIYVDRPGGDYTHFSTASPGECQASCTGDPHCAAYTYVAPGIQGPEAVCWLKTSVPDPVVDSCCDSGVKASPGAFVVDTQIDRPGGDYTHFSTASPGECQASCTGDPHCAAYTYVRRGIQGPTAVCWLKASMPAAVANPCCDSGVKASPACPTGSFDFYRHNDPSRHSISLVIAADQHGNCSGAIGWYIAGTPTYTEHKLNAFSYEGGSWYEAWNTGTPGDKYTIVVEENGDIEAFWGSTFHGYATRAR